jgi:F-box interacting protein
MDYSPHKFVLGTVHLKVWFRLWNPATRTISNILGSSLFCNKRFRLKNFFAFAFGYDNSTNIYKVVALSYGGEIVRVFSFGDNIWRTIQSFPMNTRPRLFRCDICAGVYLSCTVNWLAYRTDLVDDSGIKKLVIISLDLSTERYTQMLPPQGFDQKEYVWRNLCVLKNSLCFYQDLFRTDFVIWQMTEFGDEKSWTQFLKFSYQSIGMNNEIVSEIYLFLTPLHLSRDCDTLVLAINRERRAILYSRRTKRSRKTNINEKIDWFSIKDYVESLVTTC